MHKHIFCIAIIFGLFLSAVYIHYLSNGDDTELNTYKRGKDELNISSYQGESKDIKLTGLEIDHILYKLDVEAELRKSMEGGKLRCMPYLYLLGVMKCGTTDLFERLVLHPEIRRSSGKEIRHWQKYLRNNFTRKIHRNLANYLDHFDEVAKDILKHPGSKSVRGYHRGITLDASPDTFRENLGWRYNPGNAGLDEPRYIAAHAIRTLTPHVKLLLILRDPVTRFRSHYRMLHPQFDPQQFHELVVDSVSVWRECVLRSGLRACAYNNSLPREFGPGKISTLYIIGSMYSIFLADWFSIFPRKQLMVIKAEDYYKNTQDTLREIFQFLDVKQPSEMKHYARLEVRNTAESRGRSNGTMWSDTEKILQELFAPMKKDLAALLNDERFLWD